MFLFLLLGPSAPVSACKKLVFVKVLIFVASGLAGSPKSSSSVMSSLSFAYVSRTLCHAKPPGGVSGEVCTTPLDVKKKTGQGGGHHGMHAPSPTRCFAPRGAHAPLPVLLTGARGGAGAAAVLASPCHRADRETEREQGDIPEWGRSLRPVDPSRVPLRDPGRTACDF